MKSLNISNRSLKNATNKKLTKVVNFLQSTVNKQQAASSKQANKQAASNKQANKQAASNNQANKQATS